MSKSTVIISALALGALPGVWAAPRLIARQEPDEFEGNNNIGPGGSNYVDSAHFRVYGATDNSAGESALSMLEAVYSCFVDDLGYRSTGLSYNDNSDSGPWTKVNIYSVSVLEGAAGVMHSDFATGMAWLEVVHQYLTEPGVTVHEFGHGLHYHQQAWVDQSRTGAWWETFANWVADTYQTSPLCASAREQHGQPEGNTGIELAKTIGDSFQVIVDGSVGSGNYYQAWPFLTYLTNNPDNLDGLGSDTLLQMNVQYEANSNETPLHALQRVAGSTSVAEIVGSYWAHMAYVDIGHDQAHERFLSQRGSLNYNNVQSSGDGSYTVISARQPQYMGANIIPLESSNGSVSVEITNASGAYTATLAVMGSNEFRYVAVDGSATVEVGSGEEVSLVVANTPEELILYDPFSLSGEVSQGLDYSFTLSGATVASTSRNVARDAEMSIMGGPKQCGLDLKSIV